MVEAVVRVWHQEEGWGVLDSPETPGGCWTHFSNIQMESLHELRRGQRVALVWEEPGQDGWPYRAVRVIPGS